ncbi:hypothetical protein LIER_35901 [Lithospermum erythrorhizon]|uniref:Retrotransposon gag domain-containing protein n=1 Tax=Lithospermum erythrorhizon TaxID=34254 RepID=A0AAV3NXY1_LITER
MVLEYGSASTASYRTSVVHQTIPPVDVNAASLQELLANHEFLANSIHSYANTADAFIAKYCTSITNKQDLQQAPRESLKDFHERYKSILSNIPSIDNKIAYMVFYRGLNYGKLKKALVLDTPPPHHILIWRIYKGNKAPWATFGRS